MKDYQIQKKRDGQSWEDNGTIYEANFQKAKIEFAKRMTDKFREGTDNVVWREGNEGTGFYLYDDLIVSKSDIEAGIDFFTDDVWSFQLLNREER